MTNTPATHYTPVSKFFHWSVALIVICLLGGSFFLDDVPEQYKPIAYMIHKSLGLTVLCLMIIRIIWLQRKPRLPVTVPLWQKLLSRTIHYSLYILLLLMPLSGWIMSVAANKTPTYFGLFRVPLPINPDIHLAKLMNQSHFIIAWILIALIVLHILGALKHYFVDKDKVLQRMLPGADISPLK